MRISCASDPYSAGEDFGGIVCWKPCAEMEAMRIKPGYIHIKNTQSGNLPSSSEGIVHGKVTKDLTGLEPSEVAERGGVIIGFSVMKGQFTTTSRACNISGPYKDGDKGLNDIEEKYLRAMIDIWKERGEVGFNMPVSELDLIPVLEAAASGGPEVVFKVRFDMFPGQEMHMVGSCDLIGAWDLGRSVRMAWTKGNVWKAKVVFPAGTMRVEYKYVFRKADGAMDWEHGGNHVLELPPDGHFMQTSCCHFIPGWPGMR